ncbi:MAG: FAD-binding oxidoreductase [Myxococcales bacterium]|nr:FAD-binding oxidoreductase [Myxococcales bacterium]
MRDRRAVAATNAARGDLIDRVGADRVWIGAPARERCGLPDDQDPVAVVRPSSAEQVRVLLKIARARHLAVVVRSGLPAVEPSDLAGVVVVDARGLDRPPAIDISRRVVTVGAGVAVHAVDRAARQARLCLRGVPALLGDETIGALLGAGVSGEIGLGDASLLSDVVSANVVAGNGRQVSVGHAALLTSVPWRSEGLPDPAGLLLGAAGRLAVLCEVTLRLHPAPWVAWSVRTGKTDRKRVLSVMSAARLAITKRAVDTVLVDEGSRGRVAVRAATWRGEADLAAVTELASAAFSRHRVRMGPWESEARRVRLGHEPGQWPEASKVTGATFEVRCSWPDALKVLDVSDALQASAEGPKVLRSWAFGADYVRIRYRFRGPGSERHPLVTGVRHLLDAGAVPVGLGGALRNIARERMGPGSKVLLTGLSRTWDPDGVLGSPAGLV